MNCFKVTALFDIVFACKFALRMETRVAFFSLAKSLLYVTYGWRIQSCFWYCFYSMKMYTHNREMKYSVFCFTAHMQVVPIKLVLVNRMQGEICSYYDFHVFCKLFRCPDSAYFFPGIAFIIKCFEFEGAIFYSVRSGVFLTQKSSVDEYKGRFPAIKLLISISVYKDLIETRPKNPFIH